MDSEELFQWFEDNKKILETAYMNGTLPWQQSGFGLRTLRSEQGWTANANCNECVKLPCFLT